MNWFDWIGNPTFTVKYNSDGWRGYEATQATFESRADAERWIRENTNDETRKSYWVVRT